MSTRRALRKLLAGDELVVAPGVYDGLSAALTEAAGYQAAYLTGAGIAVSAFGLPDIGLTTMTEVATQAARLSSRLDIPLIVDCDTGFGHELNVFRTVQELERAGAAAIQIEDQGDHRRCGHLPGKSVIACEDFEVKLAAAQQARRDPDLAIIARTDARAPLGFDAALERARRYRVAGADVIFFEAPESMDEIKRIAAEVEGPLMFNVVARGNTPPVTLAQLQALGYRLAIIPGATIKAAASAMSRVLAALTSPEGMAKAQEAISSAELFEIVGLSRWSDRQDALVAGMQRGPVG